jgi:RNA polymerase sigma factor (sigma-70 family)
MACENLAPVFNSIMPRDELLPTSASLLQRLKDPADQASWDQFYELYRELIFSVARRAGLNEAEAGEVVQDTLISVARKMPEFTYDPAKDSFKGWLLTVSRWRIRDQLAKRADGPQQEPARRYEQEQDSRTATIERVADPTGPELEHIWEQEWEAHVLQKALARIKRQVHPQHYQIYHLNVILGQSAREVSRALGVNTAQIYLAKHRVGFLLKREANRLRRKLV